MRKGYRKRSGRGKQVCKSGKIRRQAVEAAGHVQLPLTVEALVEMARESLSSFAVEVGLRMAECLLEDEVTRRCGQRHERLAQRRETRYGHQAGFVTLGGQKVPLRKPRVRSTSGAGEAELERYSLLQSPDAMPQATLARLVNGVSCRRYEAVVDLARAAYGVKKSSVSRSFVRASAEKVRNLAERRFDNQRFVAIFIDGVAYAGQTMVVALGISASGEKRLLGLRQGATENAEVCSSLLEELRERGVSTSQPTLFVLDGAKALRAAVGRVWGKFGVVQRCQAHKKRNIQAHLPQKHHEELSRQLNGAWHGNDHQRAVKALRTTVQWLRRLSPDAAASLEEGLEETLTVVRFQLPEPLRKTLSTTNPIESAFSVADAVTRRVKRWRDGDMRQRWCVAGLLDAESRFRRVKGYRHLNQLIAVLDQDVHGSRLDPQRKGA